MDVDGWRTTGDEALLEIELAEPTGTRGGFFVLAWTRSVALDGTHLESSRLPAARQISTIWSRAFARTITGSEQFVYIKSRTNVCVRGPQMIR